MAGITGVYRNEKYVVVERQHHQFPQYCIWCNSAVDGAATAVAADGNASVQLPVCGACAATRNRLPRFVAILGVTALIAALVLFFSAGAVFAAALFLAGLIIAWRLHIAARSFRAAHEDEQYLWITGAHRNFLNALPVWPGMTLAELQRSRHG
ncbi:MAG: hypothetical protein Q8L95_05630 [Burkholderiales bacterium]|nr:hypothetical protein [Burkholderiales bacterium]